MHVTMVWEVLYMLLWYGKCYACYYGNGSFIHVTMVMEVLYMLL